MSHKKNFVKKQGLFYRSLVATALIANGVFQLVAPVLAEGTAANQEISNTATATYDDDDDPNTPPINTTSNTVKVTVAEVAGITVVGAGPVFQTNGDANNDGNFNARDEFYFVYDVQNVGNDPTKFQIPGTPTVNGPGTLDGSVEISYDGTNWITVPTGGTTTNSVLPGGIVKVRVPVKVNDDAPTDGKISVELGNTNPDAQNQPRTADGDDVYTVDNADNSGNGEVNGVPVNGDREASATQEITVDSSLTTYALARVLKTNSNYASAGAIGPVGDTLDYNLSLEVLNTDPTGNNISPVALEGKTVPGLPGNNILVSDAIPEGTKLKSVNAPAGWTAVYSITAVTADANLATWTAVAPTNLATVKRVGFVKTGTVNPGITVPGFKITVEVTSTTNSVTIANVAQLFGKTPNGKDVYDESGDAQPSNYDEVTQLFPSTTQKGEVPTTIPDNEIDDGFVEAAELPAYGTDTNNDNTGTGAGGEANVYTINAVGVSSILNGPNGAPDANVGGDNNIDFTNKSATVPAGIAPNGTVPDPGIVSFTNTLKNTGNSRADIVLAPQAPAIPGDLPNTTKVTLTYDKGLATEQKVIYTYDGAGAGTFTQDATTPNPIKILAVASNDTRNYTVDVELPDDSPLSTDTEKGSPVPIRAFVDNDDDGQADEVIINGTPQPAQNITINRVYVGYLKLIKTSRILKGTGPDIATGEDTFSNSPKNPRPGNIIEYKIEYQNISEVQGGPGNVILNAKNVEIVEDGTLSTAPGDGKNNWAKDNDNDGGMDTLNVPGTAVAATATITYTPPADDTNVTKYMVKGEVAPGVTKTFTFQRQVNSVSPTGTANNGTPPTGP